jgi:hypothetical protein
MSVLERLQQSPKKGKETSLVRIAVEIAKPVAVQLGIEALA